MFYISNVCSLKVHLYVCTSVLYIYIMNICSSVGTRTLSLPHPFLFLISIILYLYTEMRNTLSRPYPFPPLSYPFLPFPLFTLLLYTLYIERNILSRNFYHFSRPFLTLYYTPIIYRRGNTLPAPFLPLYKVSTFTPPFSLLFL